MKPLKKFDKHEREFERKRQLQDKKYKAKKKAQLWKDVGDFIKNRAHQRKLDAQITKKFEKRKKGRKRWMSRQRTYHRRVTLNFLHRVKKSRAFALIKDEMNFLSLLKKVDEYNKP